MLPLHSERLTLRRFSEADAPAFLAYRNGPEIARYQGWEGCSPAEAHAFIARQSIQPEAVPGEWLQIAIAQRQTEVLIGDCAMRVEARDNRQASIGLTLARKFQGHGFGSEAAGCLFDYLFLHLNLHRVMADTDPQNAAAWGLADRMGMRREGHLHQSLWFKGRWADEYVYAILREEWLARRAQATQHHQNSSARL